MCKWVCLYGRTCRQHGHQQVEHLRGLSRRITSLLVLSKIFIVKGRPGPQMFLVQQFVSGTKHIDNKILNNQLALSSCDFISQKWVFLSASLSNTICPVRLCCGQLRQGTSSSYHVKLMFENDNCFEGFKLT